MVHRIIGLLATLGLVFGVATDAAAQATPTALVSLVSQQVIDIPDGQPFAFSPDGSRLGVYRHGDTPQICSYAVEKHAIERCAPFSGRSVDPVSGVWSPDGTHLAFTEDGLHFFDETDLWVFDAESGILADLTDDGISGGRRTSTGTNIPLDFAPAWSPDGTELTFARSIKTGKDGTGHAIMNTTLYRIPVAGGEPKAVTKVADEVRAIEAGIRWLADGRILYSVNLPGFKPENGLWSISPDGTSRTQIVNAQEAGTFAALLVAVSAAGLAMLMDTQGHYWLVDLPSGSVRAFVNDGLDGDVFAAAFSPDGTAVLFEHRQGLALRDLGRGATVQLGKLDHAFARRNGLSGIVWAPNGTAFGLIEPNMGQLLGLTGP